MVETSGLRSLIGAIWLLAAIVGVGAWMLVTGKGRVLSSRMSIKYQRILSIFGLVAATLLVIGYLISDWANWTTLDALTISVWVEMSCNVLTVYVH